MDFVRLERSGKRRGYAPREGWSRSSRENALWKAYILEAYPRGVGKNSEGRGLRLPRHRKLSDRIELIKPARRERWRTIRKSGALTDSGISQSAVTLERVGSFLLATL